MDSGRIANRSKAAKRWYDPPPGCGNYFRDISETQRFEITTADGVGQVIILPGDQTRVIIQLPKATKIRAVS